MGKAKAVRTSDGLLICVTCTLMSAFVITTLVIFANSFSPAPSSLTVSAAVCLAVLGAAGIACIVSMLFAADLWLLMGNASLTRRLSLALAVNGILAVFVVAGASFGLMRMNSEGAIDVFFGIATQRLLVLSVLGVTSFCLQHFCRWRITGPFGEGTSQGRFQTSIGDLLVGTAMIAGMLGCLTYWMQQSDLTRAARYRSREFLQMLVGMSVMELVGVLCYLLLPLLLAYSSRFIRRHYPSAVALWVCFCGSIASLLVLPAYGGWDFAEALIFAGLVLVGHMVFAAGMLVVLWLMTGSGYRILTGPTQREPSFRPPRPIVRFACVATVVLTALFYALIDIPTLFETGSFSFARRVAWMTRDQGRFPNRVASWPGQQMRFSNPRYFQFSGDQDVVANRLRTAIVPSDGTVDINIFSKHDVSAKVLTELQRKSITHLVVTCHDLDPKAFDEFCQLSDVRHITIDSPKLTPEHFRSLHKLVNLVNVELIQPLRYTSEIGMALKGLPFKSLTIRLNTDRLEDFSGLTGIDDLTIRNSNVSSEVIDRLSQLRLKRLGLESCELDQPAMKRLSEMKLDALDWSYRDADPAGEPILLQLADAAAIGRLEIETTFDALFVTKFQNRAKLNPENQVVGSGKYREQLDDESPESLFDVLSQEFNGDFDAVLAKMATEFVRNEAGQIVELDLQEMPLRGLQLDKLPQLESLSRLRLGHFKQSRNLFERVGRLSSLRTLEISGHGFDNQALANVCKLKDLRRLQLPLCPVLDFQLIRRPERIPIADESQLELIDVDWLAELLRLPSSRQILLLNDIHAEQGEYGGAYGGYGMGGYGGGFDFPFEGDAEDRPIAEVITPEGFRTIAQLEQLEYLFMPGYLLSAETLESIAQLKELKELHAVFSLVDSDLLDRISAFRQLEALSIGVAGIDRQTVRRLAKLKELRVLQIIVFDFRVQTPAQRKAIKASLEAALPDCEIHLIYLPAEGSYGTGQGGMF